MIHSVKQVAALATLFIAASSVAHGEVHSENQAERVVINVALQFEGDQNKAVVWVADGTSFAALSAVARAIQEHGLTDISLSVSGQDLSPTLIASKQHAGIRLHADHAELFITDEVPYSFTKVLCEALTQLKGIDDVELRRSSLQADQRRLSDRNDPFGGPSGASVTPSPQKAKGADPFSF